MRYILTAAIGDAGGTYQKTLGTIIHRIAERHPGGDLAAMQADLAEAWPDLELGEGWAARRLRADADLMVATLAKALQCRPAAIATEHRFRVELADAVLTGVIDRVEPVPEGGSRAVKVVDLKTGKSPISHHEAAENPQLAAYQMAIEHGGLDEVLPGATPAGAELLYVAKPNPLHRRQGGLAGDPWPAELVARIVADLSGAVFEARSGKWCDHCTVRGACPVRVDGTRVRS